MRRKPQVSRLLARLRSVSMIVDSATRAGTDCASDKLSNTPRARGRDMLSNMQIHPTIPATDLARARKFYEGTLGFKPNQETPAGVIYQAGADTWFILYPTQFAGTAQHTVASWRVKDLDAEMADLRKR